MLEPRGRSAPQMWTEPPSAPAPLCSAAGSGPAFPTAPSVPGSMDPGCALSRRDSWEPAVAQLRPRHVHTRTHGCTHTRAHTLHKSHVGQACEGAGLRCTLNK